MDDPESSKQMEPRVRKLAQLRARTDRQLVELISTALDRGFAYAHTLAAQDPRSQWPATMELRERADESWREAQRLVSALDGVSESKRAALERRTAVLRETLDQFGADHFPIQRAACF